MDWPTVIGGAVTLLGAGGGLGVLGKTWLDSRRLAGEQRIAEAEQPVEQYAEIVKELRAEQTRLGAVIDTMRREYEKALSDSRKEHAECLHRFGRLEGQLEEMRRQVRHFEETTTAKQKQALTETAAMGHKIIKAAAVTAVEVATKTAGDSGVLKSGPIDREHPLPVEVVKPPE